MYDPLGTVRHGEGGWDLQEYEWDRKTGEGAFKYGHPTRSRPLDVFRMQRRFWLPLPPTD